MPVAIAVTVAVLTSPAAFAEPYEPTLVFRFAITPAPLPTPRLKYELLPPHRDRTPGNAAIDYLRAAVLLPKPPRIDDDEARQAREDMLYKWRTSKLHKLPIDAVKAELKPFNNSMTAADRAARAAGCDWQLPDPLTMKNSLGEEVQSLREIVSWLRFRVKLELAEGRFADAERTLQTAFQMSRHVGEGPTLVQSLVGVALAAIALDAAAEWGTAPGSPNLYWALATLPDPLLDLRPTVAGEARVMANSFPLFGEFEKGPVSEARALELIDASRTEIQTVGDMAVMFDKTGPGSPPDKALAAVFAVLLREKPTKFEAAVRRMTDDFAAVCRAPAARKWLRARGVKDVDAMPALQASYLASWLRFRDRYDDIAAATLLPTREAVAAARRVIQATDAMRPEVRDDTLAQGLLSTVIALEKILLHHVRIRRQIAAVRAVHAVRAHLAASGGKLPASWDEVTVVPVPNDPLTGKPFVYALKDGKATIIAPPPDSEQMVPPNNFRYELTVRR